jgi:hypothetical protein
LNTQEYIDSGALELYAAGGLTPAESQEVEDMAAQFPDVRLALEECLRAMEAYAVIHARAPRPELEERIIQHIQAGTAPVADSAPGAEAKVVPLVNREREEVEAPAQRWWQIAAVVLLVISAAINVYLYNNLRQTKNELASTQQSVRQYALQVNHLEQRSLQSENQLGMLRNPRTLAVQLKGVPKHTEAQARVYWNQETKEVYLDPTQLPAAPAGKQYQLWALAQGKPIDAGVVNSSEPTLHRMKQVEEAQAFAVTLEPEGGSVNPTLDEMYAMGNATR